MEKRGEIILYQPDSEVRLEVRLEEETVWLTQEQIAALFGTKENWLKTAHVPFWNIWVTMGNKSM